jgi:hypothetical protein
MAVDNRVGGIVVDRVRAFVRWHRHSGTFSPGADEAPGYELSIDDEDQRALARERLTRVDLEAAFAEEP